MPNKEPKVAFFTVCGGGVDYEFLLGSLAHHAKLGAHLVLDTTHPDERRSFKNLPSTVMWVYEPLYRFGKNFQYLSAMQRALRLAEEHFKPDILAMLDCDDFYSMNVKELFGMAMVAMLELQYVHWRTDGHPYLYGESEWHGRIWPARRGVMISLNEKWILGGRYNGNPEHHPLQRAVAGLPTLRMAGLYRHHLHYSGLGGKHVHDEVAQATIAGWPDGGKRVPRCPWPLPLRRWRDTGRLPSEDYA